MVKNIEHFRPELEFDRLANRKIAMYREVPLHGAKASKGIPSQVSLTGRIAREIDRWITARRSSGWFFFFKQKTAYEIDVGSYVNDNAVISTNKLTLRGVGGARPH